MSIELPLPQQPRRTWRQWSRLTRVRIYTVLTLIMAISAVALWWPRRGVFAIAWMGGEIVDPLMTLQIQNVNRTISAPHQAFVWSWLQPYLTWLTVDDRVVSVNLYEVRSKQIDLAYLGYFPQLNSLILNGRHIGPGLQRLKGVDSLRQLHIAGLVSTTDIGELRHLPNLEELIVGDCPVSGGGFDHLPMLPKLKQIEFYGQPNSDAIRWVGQCRELEYLYLFLGIDDEDDLRFGWPATRLRGLYI